MIGRRWKIAVGVVGAVLAVAAGMAAWQGLRSTSPVGLQSEAFDRLPPGPALKALPGALLMDYQAYEPQTLAGGAMVPGGWSVRALPLKPGSLEPIEGREGIDFGRSGYSLVSPDGARMVISTDATGEFSIFDLVRWEVEATLTAEPGVRAIGWSLDGRVVIAARDHCSASGAEGSCPGGWIRDLWTIDVASGAINAAAEYDFQPSQWHLDGRGRAITLGLDTETCCGIDAEGPAFVAVIDLVSGETVGRIELPDLLMGQPKHWLGNTDVYAWYGPATVLSPDGSTLYVFDSVDQIVTAVDLEAMRVAERKDLKEPRTWFSRALDKAGSWFVSVAEAKGGPSYSRQATITPDGRYLVSSGTVSLPVDEPQWSGDSKQRPAGLLVIDAETLEIVYREEAASTFGLSPDGRWLLAAGSYWDEELTDQNEYGAEVAFGVRIIDMAALKETAHLWDGEAIWPDHFSPDGRYAYVVTQGPGLLESRRLGTSCSGDCYQLLNLVELATGKVVSERRLGSEQGIGSLIPAR